MICVPKTLGNAEYFDGQKWFGGLFEADSCTTKSNMDAKQSWHLQGLSKNFIHASEDRLEILNFAKLKKFLTVITKKWRETEKTVNRDWV